MYRHLFRGIFWGVTSSVGVILIQLALTLVVGRQSAELLGLLNFVEMVNSGFMALFFVGGGVSLTNYINRSKGRSMLPVVGVNVGVAALIAGLGVLVMVWLGGVGRFSGVHLFLLVSIGLGWLTANQLAVERAAHFDFRFSNFLEKGSSFFLCRISHPDRAARKPRGNGHLVDGPGGQPPGGDHWPGPHQTSFSG